MSILLNSQPLITVITVAYNSALYIRETIKSVLNQTYKNIEYIIGDDGSSDNTWSIINEFDNPLIRKYRNESNIGEYPNRNKALHLATGAYLIFIDGDDIMFEHALATFVHYVKQFPESGMFFSRDWDYRLLPPVKLDPVTMYRFHFFDNSIIGSNFTKVLFKTEPLQKEKLSETIRTGDTFIQLKLAQTNAAVVIPEGLTWWRRRKGNASSQVFKDKRYIAESINFELRLLSEGCPLSKEEIEQAKINVYSVYLRILCRMLLKAQFSELRYLISKVYIPYLYYKSVFKKSKRNYYSYLSGDQPLTSKV